MKAKAPKIVNKKSAYAEAGVDRVLRARSKKALVTLWQTYQYSLYGSVVGLPYGNIIPMGGDSYLDLVIEGIGSKVLVAQLADKYDTIGIDGVAVAANDVIRSGAKPLALADNIHAHVSDPALVEQWMKGIAKGAEEAQCPVSSGEIGDVPDLIKGLVEGKGFDMVFASVGQVHGKDIVHGNGLKLGDALVGMRSSGIHSNGVSLARKVLFKRWGGAFEPFDVPDGLDRGVVYEVLEPTTIYVKSVMKLVSKHLIKAAVHITGDAYLKFDRLMRFNRRIGFEFDNFRPQPVFQVIQTVAKQRKTLISDEEMFKTFNMGWGFAVVVDDSLADATIDLLGREGMEADRIGRVTGTKRVVIKHGEKTINLKQ